MHRVHRTAVFHPEDPSAAYDGARDPADPFEPFRFHERFESFEYPVRIRGDPTRNHVYELSDLVQHIRTAQEAGRPAKNPYNPAQIITWQDIEDVSWPGRDTRAEVRRVLAPYLTQNLPEITRHELSEQASAILDEFEAAVLVQVGARTTLLSHHQLEAHWQTWWRQAHPHLSPLVRQVALGGLYATAVDEILAPRHLIIYNIALDAFWVSPTAALRAQTVLSNASRHNQRLADLLTWWHAHPRG